MRLRPGLTRLSESVGQAERMRLRPVDTAAGIQQVQGRLLADSGWERHGQREALMDADQGEVRREPGLWRGYPEVGGHRETQAAADRGTLDCRDHRQWLLEHACR